MAACSKTGEMAIHPFLMSPGQGRVVPHCNFYTTVKSFVFRKFSTLIGNFFKMRNATKALKTLWRVFA